MKVEVEEMPWLESAAFITSHQQSEQISDFPVLWNIVSLLSTSVNLLCGRTRSHFMDKIFSNKDQLLSLKCLPEKSSN